MGRAVGGSPGAAVVAAKSQAGAEESFSVTSLEADPDAQGRKVD